MTRQDNTSDNYFGHLVADPYRWLEDDNSDETAQWVAEQNRRTRSHIDAIPFRLPIAQRLKQIWQFQRKGAPFRRGNRYFFSGNSGLQNQDTYYMADSLDDTPVEILNPNTLSDNGTIALAEFSVSPDGRYLGYGIARNGSDWNEYFVRDLTTLTDLPDHLCWIKFSGIEWFGDGFFYSRYPQPTGSELTSENVDNAVYYHRLGTSQADDTLIYSDPDHNERSFYASVTDDFKMLVITITESTTGNAICSLRLPETRTLDGRISELCATLKQPISHFDDDFIILGHHNDRLIFLTNSGAPRYHIVAIDPDAPDSDNWTILVPESDDTIADAHFARGNFFINYMHDAHSRLAVCDYDGSNFIEVPLPCPGSVSSFVPSNDSDEAFISFSSFVMPSRVYIYKVSDNTTTHLHSWDSSIDFPFDDFVTRQVFYSSSDGTRIPMFLTHRKDIVLDGTNPTWLYGYGGFNISLMPSFDVKRLLWLEQGGVYAVANIRGGGEYGEEWHQSGTLMNKQNVFNDFIAAARYLIDQKYTSSDHLVCQGGSNGGLLIGAVINQAPELFRVAIPQVGVMDMLRYHKFTIGRYWATDYGTSADSDEMFRYLYAYSPLHNIADRNYPSTLITTGDHDDRVVPAHSFKYAATMQDTYTGERPILIRIEHQAGHGAGKPIDKLINEWSDIYAFTFHELGGNFGNCYNYWTK